MVHIRFKGTYMRVKFPRTVITAAAAGLAVAVAWPLAAFAAQASPAAPAAPATPAANTV
jgi:hypothetical protein